MMRFGKSVVALLFALASFGVCGGCGTAMSRGISTGLADGISGGITSVIDAIVTAFIINPITNIGAGGGSA